ncbi:MAG TPA: hypothetical protein VGK24_06620 [Candidatus Angelobacter sp.]
MRSFVLTLLFFIPLALFGDTPISCSLIPFTDTTHSIDTKTGVILNYPVAKTLAASQLKSVPTYDPKRSSVIIHVVLLENTEDIKTPGAFAVTVKASHWYAVDPVEDWSTSSTRLYGTNEPFVLLIFLKTKENSFSTEYSYTFAGRNPAPVQDLTDAAKLFQATVGSPVKGIRAQFSPAIAAAPEIDQFCWTQISVAAPGAIDITPKVASSDSTNTVVAIDAKPTEFDDEGFYHWDVSVGVPILSYKQLQAVTAPGADLTANVDKRNLFLVGDWYLKPVDVKNNGLSKVPYLVAGASVASKPLHSILAGIGWGPTIANFYGGLLIITNNLPNHQTERVIKGAFGINLPVRAIMGKLGLNTQTTSGK